uniref:Methyl-CpG binding domain protein 3b n=1 Tax=Esox lucius TaxID=8010 RepID=A0A6Q2YXS4_ESOLU
QGLTSIYTLYEVWVSAKLLQDYSPGDKNEVLYPVASPAGLPPLGNPDILEGENDLTALSFLHEPAVLHNLRVRFLDYSSIYTYCGIVLVALNPYDQLPIYGEEVIDAYSGQDMADMEPHIFSVAEEAYRTMTREEKNQSIIISGESGAGKTVSAKFTMRYFAVVGGAAQQTSVEERVLASNPIMESFGNAKTTRNNNSSRFGKYIEIGFGRKGDIIGANMKTYLLEKSRVVFQSSQERNYHIFYQLCSSRNLPEMRVLQLDAAETFHYTNQGGRDSLQIPGTDDIMDLEHTRNALTILGVLPEQQMELFRILAAVLHLGNVHIQASGRGGDRSYIDREDRSLGVFSNLLGVERTQMAHWLCHHKLAVGGEMLVKPMSGQQALEARDALAKHVYGQLFMWTVTRLNSALRAQGQRPKAFIGVLDIYGFETFEKNSFEQFCINYANEKLQQQFNRHVFQLEQEEYVREELPWSRIEFSDNQPCIALIEGQLGVLDLLDEECRMPKGSEENWARKLYDQHQSNKPSPHFRKPRMSNSAFIILHFADMVQYECDGFLEKNRDTVFEEPINVLRAKLVAELFQQAPAGGNLSLSAGKSSIPNGSLCSGPGKRAHREHKLTVSFQFRQSLQLLMEALNSTTPHYVRCIKPNDLKEPFVFDPKRAVQQLRACGVLETIRISAAGFPSRWTYAEFYSRYRVLLGGSGVRNQEQIQALCQLALPQLIPDPEQYCFGKTKVFFRAGQVALLERLRAERLRAAGVIIQSWVKGWLGRRRYHKTRWATLTIQRYTRGALARRLADMLRYTKAAVVIQKTYRMVAIRQMFLTIRKATVTIQAFTRGTLARRQHRLAVVERAAVLLQSAVRGWLARQAFRRVRAAVVLVQCCVRRKAARRELLRRKAEARSVEKFRELNKGMEVKLMQLQLRADHQARESEALRETLLAERKAHSNELSALRGALLKLENQLRTQLQTQQARPTSVASEKEMEERRKAEERAGQEILRLTQVRPWIHVVVSSLRAPGCSEECAAQQDKTLTAELDEERRKYQGLLREFTRLEQRYDNLREMSMLTEVLMFYQLAWVPVCLLAKTASELALTSAPAKVDYEKKGQFIKSLCVSKFNTNHHLVVLCLPTSLCFPDVRVDVGLSLPPGLAAKVLFLCVRQADGSGDKARARSLCAATVTAIKGALKKHCNDVDMTAMWLKNSCLLTDLLTQHSTRQDLVPLTTDLSDFIRALSDLCIQSYQQLLSVTESRLQPIIVPSMLESEMIPGLSASGVKLGGSRKRTGSDPRAGERGAGEAPSMAAVLRVLGALHMALSRQALPPTVTEQAFRQLTHLLSASALNSLLLRKDMCSWSRGLQIRYNVSLLEEWLRSRELQAGGAVALLEPLIQATQLLQVGKKTEADAQALVHSCNALSTQQIVKILTLYTPHSDLEERVTLNFIRVVQGLLKERSGNQAPQLLLDVRRVFPVTFPYLPPSPIRADQLDIPDSLKISFLRRT